MCGAKLLLWNQNVVFNIKIFNTPVVVCMSVPIIIIVRLCTVIGNTLCVMLA